MTQKNDKNYKNQPDEFTFFQVYKIFTTILEIFPKLKQNLPSPPINYVFYIKNLPTKKKYAFFNTIISKNSEAKIRKQLYVQLSSLKIIELKENWRVILLKLQKLIDLALINGDKELITNLMQLLILIKCSM